MAAILAWMAGRRRTASLAHLPSDAVRFGLEKPEVGHFRVDHVHAALSPVILGCSHAGLARELFRHAVYEGPAILVHLLCVPGLMRSSEQAHFNEDEFRTSDLDYIDDKARGARNTVEDEM